MCSRYELSATPRRLEERFRLRELPPDLARPEIRPTDKALVIVADAEERWRGEALAWGLEASWDGKPLINARAETLTQRKTFRPLLTRRCLVPANAYFEWRPDAGRRLKNRIARDDGDVLAFAGLRDDERFTIVTCAPAAAIAHIHDRMPVILDEAAETPWLDPKTPFEAIAWALVPFAGALAAAEDRPPAPRQRDLFG